MMHVLIVRQPLVEAHPDLPRALPTVQDEAHGLAAAELIARNCPKVALARVSAVAGASLATKDAALS